MSHVQQMANDCGDYSWLKHFQKNEKLFVSNTQKKESLCVKYVSESAKRTYYTLERLRSTAERNESREKGGYRYDRDNQYFATYLRLMAGPLAYDTIQRNLQCAKRCA